MNQPNLSQILDAGHWTETSPVIDVIAPLRVSLEGGVGALGAAPFLVHAPETQVPFQPQAEPQPPVS